MNDFSINDSRSSEAVTSTVDWIPKKIPKMTKNIRLGVGDDEQFQIVKVRII